MFIKRKTTSAIKWSFVTLQNLKTQGNQALCIGHLDGRQTQNTWYTCITFLQMIAALRRIVISRKNRIAIMNS